MNDARLDKYSGIHHDCDVNEEQRWIVVQKYLSRRTARRGTSELQQVKNVRIAWHDTL